MGMTVVKMSASQSQPDPAVALSLEGCAGDAQRGTADAGQTAVAGNLGWRQTLPEEYDLAVAFLEGGSAYYVADHVRAKKGGVYSYRLSEGGIQQGTGPRLLPAI